MTCGIFSIKKVYLDFIRPVLFQNKFRKKTKQITMTILAIRLQAILYAME